MEKNLNTLDDELLLDDNNDIVYTATEFLTFIRHSHCPKCSSIDSFELVSTPNTEIKQYTYKCKCCGFTKELYEPMSSIVYLMKDEYEKQVKETGKTDVIGTYK